MSAAYIQELIKLPLLATFMPQNNYYLTFFSSAIFIIEIILNFNLGYYDRGQIIIDRKKIAYTYIKNNFIIDSLCLLSIMI